MRPDESNPPSRSLARVLAGDDLANLPPAAVVLPPLTPTRLLARILGGFDELARGPIARDGAPFLGAIAFLMAMSTLLTAFSTQPGWLSTWRAAWCWAVIGGVVLAAPAYWAAGAVAYLLVRLGGGARDFRAARHLFACAFVPWSLVVLAAALARTALYGDAYLATGAGTGTPLDLALLVATHAASLYGYTLFHIGARAVHRVGTARGVATTLVVPLALAMWTMVEELARAVAGG